ncbi:MAG: D-tyrosyl-tRNA(Tyr) deacylase [Clostridiales bacterium]|nr:D-tyrosyl-tRNA(Tyr) deacylase [Clostridiales bacterium]
MRCVVQRVTSASVTSMGEMAGEIGKGLMVLLGVEEGDTEKDAVYMAGKIVKLRIFEDENEKMNLSVRDVQGDVLCVSQFTLLGDARGQNRPGFTKAENPARADELYILTCEEMRKLGVKVETGVFRTHMQVTLCNDGPVTLLLDSRKTF